MKKNLSPVIAGLVALGVAAPAVAADLRPQTYTKAPPVIAAAVYDWSGLYIGINGGAGSSHNCWNMVNLHGDALIPAANEGCHDATGGTVGGQIGYRWQAANWVFGLEGQGNWADFSGRSVNLYLDDDTIRSRTDSFGLFTGQVGTAWNNMLLYVKGGAAVVNNRFDRLNETGGLISNGSESRWGGTIGAGLEFGFSPNWSVGVEYNHIFLGNRDITTHFPNGNADATSRIRQDIDMGLVRLNYRFGGPVVAKY